MNRKLQIPESKKIEQFLGSLKFAVVIILLFTLGMIVGTFLESYYGTDFANRAIYKTPFFMLVQFCMLLSVIFAAILRLPPKKRLYGFYTIHSGLIIIGIGSLITYIAGVDGQITLNLNETNKQVILSKDIVKISYPDEDKVVTSFLPFTAFEKELDEKYEELTLKKFIPFAEGKFVWADPINHYENSDLNQTSRYHFKNAFAEQDFTLSIHPEASSEFQSNFSMGPLNISYLPKSLSTCVLNANLSKLILWDTKVGICFTPEEKNIAIKATTSKNRFLAFPYKEKVLTFFPDFSSFPIDTNFKTDEQSDIRILTLSQFEEKPFLFLFGESLAFFDKNNNKWTVKPFIKDKSPITLPWMNAEISLVDHSNTLVPFNLPIATVPIQKNGQMIKGDLRALQLEILGKEYWATNYAPLTLLIKGKKVIIEVTKEELTLPFELSLSKFKMDKDPGTDNPASYESFIKLFSDGKMTDHHVYMNHPMKNLGYTFYQASYSQNQNGEYSTTLAVNVDQGRFLKYLGSLMLVFGAIAHYYLNNKKKLKKIEANMKTTFKLILITLFTFSIAKPVFSETYFCKKELETLPILQNGRVKPLYVHALETLKNLTGKSTPIENLGPVETYCLLSLNAMGLPSKINLDARIDHVDLMKFLNLKKDEHYISYEALLNLSESIKLEMRSIKDNESYQKSIGKLYSNINHYNEIKNGQDWMFATINNNDIEWQPIAVYLTEDKVKAQKLLTPDDPFLPTLLKSKEIFDQKNPNHRYELELIYAKAHLSNWALTLTLLALACFVLFKNFNITLMLAALSVLTQAVLITFRVLISGRAPITNMYETVLFSGFGALFLALLLGHFKKEKLFVTIGLGYNLCTLMMLNFANGMLSATISPLVPVLRDNFWLSTHVTTVILSYGALALSWILANTILIKRKWGNISKSEELFYADIIYTTLKWGTTMLSAGVILGGVWADYSWGRFWGWDPKETWSLIVLCIYMAILHGRYTSWIKPHRFITITAGAFMSVMMAWFGVNYILASGLHSYGFSQGGAVFLGTFFLTQIILLILTLQKNEINS